MTILQTVFPENINNLFAWIATPLYISPLFSVQIGWGLIHLITAILLIGILMKIDVKKPVYVGLFLLILFEVFEFIISYPILLIIPETIQDTFGDLIIGLIGLLAGYKLWQK